MDFSAWDNLFNVLIIAFWFGAWGMDSRYAYFNSYLRPMHQRFEAIFAFLRPAFLGAPDRLIALVIVAVLILLRALVAPRTAEWNLTLGLAPAGIAGKFPADPWTSALAWSGISAGLFLLKFWLLTFLYLGFTRRPEGQVQTALHALTAPFSWIHPAGRPPVVLAIGIGMGMLLQFVGGNLPFSLLAGAKALLAVAAAWTMLLIVLQDVVLVAIVGHWIGIGTGAEKLKWMCAEWLDHLLGPLRNYPLRVGMFDLTPIAFFFCIGLFQRGLAQALSAAASALP